MEFWHEIILQFFNKCDYKKGLGKSFFSDPYSGIQDLKLPPPQQNTPGSSEFEVKRISFNRAEVYCTYQKLFGLTVSV